MKMLPNESAIDWAKRVQQYEYGYALMRLSEGYPIDNVLEEMSHRIANKMNHHVITNLKTVSSQQL